MEYTFLGTDLIMKNVCLLEHIIRFVCLIQTSAYKLPSSIVTDSTIEIQHRRSDIIHPRVWWESNPLSTAIRKRCALLTQPRGPQECYIKNVKMSLH